MAITLREPTVRDAPRIAELHVASWRAAYSHLLPEEFFSEEHIQGRHRMWNTILSSPRAEWTVRIAEHRENLVGFAFAGPSFGPVGDEQPRDRQLFSIYVSEKYYGAGVGQVLLDAALGAGQAMLWVAKNNPRAVAFYRRNRFEFDGVEQIDPGAPGILGARMVR